jgi:hypothetical protein
MDRIEGLKNIAAFFGWGMTKLKRRKKELLKAGAIYIDLIGSPPRKTYCAFTSQLVSYQVKKSKKNDGNL